MKKKNQGRPMYGIIFVIVMFFCTASTLVTVIYPMAAKKISINIAEIFIALLLMALIGFFLFKIVPTLEGPIEESVQRLASLLKEILHL